MGHAANSNRLDESVRRALSKIKKPSTAEEITDVMNGTLGPGDPPFHVKDVAAWLLGSQENVLSLYWLKSRPRR